jgi:hypothetical protein
MPLVRRGTSEARAQGQGRSAHVPDHGQRRIRSAAWPSWPPQHARRRPEPTSIVRDGGQLFLPEVAVLAARRRHRVLGGQRPRRQNVLGRPETDRALAAKRIVMKSSVTYSAASSPALLLTATV